MTFEFKDLPVDSFFQPEIRAGLKEYKYANSVYHANAGQKFPHPCYKKIDDVSAVCIEEEEKYDTQIVFYPNDKITYSNLPLDGEGNLIELDDPVIFNRYNRIYEGVVVSVNKRTRNSLDYDLRLVRNRIKSHYDIDYLWKNQAIFVPKVKVLSSAFNKPMLITYPRRMRKGKIKL